MYAENYKTLLKDIKEDTSKWKANVCSWIGRLNIVKTSVLPKEIFRFNTISVKILTVFFPEIEKFIQKFTWNLQGPWITKAILEKKNKILTFPDFKTYCKAAVIKLVWYWHKDKHIHQ